MSLFSTKCISGESHFGNPPKERRSFARSASSGPNNGGGFSIDATPAAHYYGHGVVRNDRNQTMPRLKLFSSLEGKNILPLNDRHVYVHL